jgi:hypothetical protein
LSRLWDTHGIGTFQETTTGKGTKIIWRDKDGEEHTKTIRHSNVTGVPVCPTAPNYDRYGDNLRNNPEKECDERELVACISRYCLTTTDIATKLSASILKPPSVPEYKINEEYIKEKEKYDDVQTLRQNQIGIIFQDEAGTTEEIGTQETEEEKTNFKNCRRSLKNCSGTTA